MSPKARSCCLLACLLAFGPVPGCARPRGRTPVEGSLTFRGRPVPFAQVAFVPDRDRGTTGPRSTGVTDGNGHFTLTCDTNQPGAVIGWHKVVVTDPRAGGRREDPLGTGAKETAPPNPADPAVPPRYGSLNTTPLRVEVKPGEPVRLELTP